MAMRLASLLKSAPLALFLAFSGHAATADAADVVKQAPHFASETLTITGKTGTAHTFTVEVAVSGPQREYGLMFRRQMAADHGMLFDFDKAQHVQMWMENTVLPLDMLFVDTAGGVTHIVENAVPYSQTIIDSGGPVKYVIELNGGIVKKLGLAVGDKVSSPTIAKR
ncbi:MULTISPECIES: DUF192 domain-containing protein [unclassified Rhizobium]|uniref:DUF192 domain-containing protein n=1 Tax=unclassified Rhizobium TaxID=2613769 RepID=UPI001ADBFCEC|nr:MULTISPECIES: DUF192 domain-containing protein [unclassified Rhizobium]MBO9098672.1 DUF192 domain-containing protein [Rhizobium sp. L58/93]MBO9132523.1 DUF192 domain-containing protein [Rhizobium sp. B209b/85]MBO9168938.1 DUF192 domain-containing protein [Rhizobium sp. L245/93]MBO9184888.1 DUF192 domain-containing protein [Rhizobium sp. E27B/91]QXZ85054.1 DUF192 domain-containing protein [Rhizobium sp. K1/93]